MCRRPTPLSGISFWRTGRSASFGETTLVLSKRRTIQGTSGWSSFEPRFVAAPPDEAVTGQDSPATLPGALMTKTIKVALAGAGAFGLKHLDAIKADRRGRGGLAGRARARQDKGSGGEIWRRPCHDGSRRHPQAAGARRRHLGDANADARGASASVPQAGKHVQIEIPLADNLKDAEAVVAEQKRAGSSPWSATPAASIRAISSCASAF